MNVAQQLPMGLIRGELSRLVGHEAQGTLVGKVIPIFFCLHNYIGHIQGD